MSAAVDRLLSGKWLPVPDVSGNYTPVLSLPRIARRVSQPVVLAGGFTIFFNTSFAKNWQGGMTFVKPKGDLVPIQPGSLLAGVDPIAGALIPTNEFVAYTFGANELDQQGEWTVYLTSATATLGTGEGSINAGSGPGIFSVLGQAFV